MKPKNNNSKTTCDNTVIYETIVDGAARDHTTRVTIDLTIDEIAKIAIGAHERNITFNKFIIEILENTISNIENNAK